MLSPIFEKLGWFYTPSIDCWHFLLRSSNETGTGMDLLPDMTLMKYEWFLNDHHAETFSFPPVKVTLKELHEMTLNLLSEKFNEDDFTL